MNILIVDDDAFVVDALHKGMDWTSLNIENVFTAYNVKNAKKILETVQIHIMLCDIEMPKENGLSLLNWIREKDYVIQTIFLTSYDEFEYASQAIELQAFNYVLKPISYEKLETVIAKAVNKEKEVLKINDYRIGYEFWTDTEKNRKDMFWQKLLNDKAPMLIDDALKYIREMGLKYKEEDTFLCMTIELLLTESVEKLDHGMIEWTIKSTSEEAMSKELLQLESGIKFDKKHWVLIIRDEPGLTIVKLKTATENIIQKISKSCNCYVCCGIGNSCRLDEVNRNLWDVIKMYEDNVLRESKVLVLSEYVFEKYDYIPPNFSVWKQLLMDLKNDELIKAMNDYLDSLIARKKVNKKILSLFMMDFIQMIFTVLNEEHIMLHGWNYEYFNFEISGEAASTVNNLRNYLRNIIRDVIKVFHYNATEKSVVDIVKEYIENNIDFDISRDSLAQLVYLNPDYLARLFKKEVGESLGNYIRDKRVQVAKDYFDTTDNPINVVAVKVGYDNFSYFSKVFKEATGYTPKDYKSKADAGRNKSND